MGWFKTKITLKEEEQYIQEILVGLLKNPKTLIEVNPADMSYMLSNEETQTYLDLDSEGVKMIQKSGDNCISSLEERISLNVIDVFKGMLKEETTKRRAEKKLIIFHGGKINLLKIIKNSLKEE